MGSVVVDLSDAGSFVGWLFHAGCNAQAEDVRTCGQLRQTTCRLSPVGRRSLSVANAGFLS